MKKVLLAVFTVSIASLVFAKNNEPIKTKELKVKNSKSFEVKKVEVVDKPIIKLVKVVLMDQAGPGCDMAGTIASLVVPPFMPVGLDKCLE